MKILIMGRSGSGKTTLANYLSEKYGLKQLDSYTTRPMRVANETGHTFITPDEAKTFTDRATDTVINGYEYFSTKQQVNESDVYVIDPNGLVKLLKNMPETDFDIVYVRADDNKRTNAAIDRADDPKAESGVVEKRMSSEDEQFTLFEEFIDEGQTSDDNPFKNVPIRSVRSFYNSMTDLHELTDFGDRLVESHRRKGNNTNES